MKKSVLVLFFLFLSLFLTPLPVRVLAPNPPLSHWIMSQGCFTPFPSVYGGPNEYNYTRMDTFNLTQGGQYVPGPGLDGTCGPVGPLKFKSGTTASSYYGEPNSTDLHLLARDWITPADPTGGTSRTLDAAVLNSTYETIRAQTNKFSPPSSGLQLKFYNDTIQGPSWNGTLTCYPTAYPWNIQVTISFNFTLAKIVVATGSLTCSTASTLDMQLRVPIVPPGSHYDDFHMKTALSGNYTASNQPAYVEREVFINGGHALGGTGVSYKPGIIVPQTCNNIGPSPTVPPPKLGSLVLFLSQDPIYAVEGSSITYPNYLVIFPNIPANISADQFKFDLIGTVPAGFSFDFSGLTPIMMTPFPPPGATMTPALGSKLITLTVSAIMGVASPAVYNLILNVTDITAGVHNTFDQITLAVCPKNASTVPVSALQLLSSIGLVTCLAATLKRRKL